MKKYKTKNMNLQLFAELSKYTNDDIDVDKLADYYKTITFTGNGNSSFLLSIPYCVRVDGEVRV